MVPKITDKNVVNSSPGLDLVPFWRLPCPRWAQDENRSEISGEVKAKMGPSCAKLPKLCPRCLKVVPSWRQDGPISSPKWPIWCPFGGYLAQDRLQTRIEAKFLAKLRPGWAHHGRSWGQLCPRRSKLEPSWRQDGPILPQHG